MALFFHLSQAIAQPVDSLIQEAYKNNPQFKSFEYQIQATGFRASSSGAWPAPTIDIEFSQIPIQQHKHSERCRIE